MSHARRPASSRPPRARAALGALAVAFAIAAAPLAPPAGAQPPPDRLARFAPVGDLAGACWSTPMPGDARDVHCWEWALGGAYLRDRHRLAGPGGEYAGETLYGWDAERAALRYWYFNTLGGVSEGEVRQGEGAGWTFTETYRGGGSVLQFRTTITRPTPDSYERVTEQLRDGEWVPSPALRLTRTAVAPASLDGPWAEAWDLVYNSSRDGDYEVYRRDLRSGEERNLTSSPASEWVYAGGESLLLVSNRPAGSEPGYRLYRLDPAGGEPARLTDFVVADSWVARVPGGGVVVCAKVDGDRELLLLDDTGSVSRRLTDNDAEDCHPDVTPDGRTLVFWSTRGGSGELWSMPLTGGEARQLTRFAGNDAVAAHLYGGEGPPRVSPDGSRIVWMAMRGGEDWDVYTMALDGSDERRLTDSLAHDGYPSWSPDGRWIVFDSDRAGSTDAWLVPADGGAAVRLTDHPGSEQAPLFVLRRP